jgi:apolipoprotein N-acyltransferase
MQASTFSIAIAGGLLMWAVQPPLALAPLAWIAPVPWLMLVRADEMPGRRPYRWLWLAGLIYWLATIQWLRLAHPAVYVGWFALSAYLAAYLPTFVAISRVAVHRWRVPLWLAAPVVWTGLELARAHLFSGFLMGAIAHTQVQFTTIIQIGDLVGEYGVDFLIVAVAAAVTSVLLPPRKYLDVLPAVLLIASAALYGHCRVDPTKEVAAVPPRQPVRVALIQGNSLPDWSFNPAKQREIMDEYVGLSFKAVDVAKRTGDGRPIDLLVWPETTFRTGLREFDSNFRLPPGGGKTLEEIAAAGPNDLAALATQLDMPILVGIDRIHYVADPAAPADEPRYHAYNSCALVDRIGKIVGTYDKTHLVAFGEYIPFATWFPFVYKYLPVTGGTEEGDGPKALCTGGVCYAPNICYETAVPHVIREQVTTLIARGQTPDILVNITNDSWYWGSSELDMHLACDVFRAVEARRPMVIAANGGISGWIDAQGRIRNQYPRQKPGVIIADVELNKRDSPYMRYGDWFAGLCLLCTASIVLINWYLKPRYPDAHRVTNQD